MPMNESSPQINTTKTRATRNIKSALLPFFSGLLPILVLAHFGHHVVGGQLTPLLPFIRTQFNLDYTRAGFLVSAFSICYGFSQLPAGWLADRVGRRITILIGTAGMGLAGVLIGLAPNYIALAASLMLLGTCGGGYHPSSAPLVSASVEPARRGRALGIHQIGGNASHFLSPLIAVGLARLFGWRGSFITMGIFATALGLALYALLGRQEQVNKVEPRKVSSFAERPAGKTQIRRLIAFLTLAIPGQSLASPIISTFAILFLVDHLKMSKEAAAGLLSVVYFGTLFAGPVAGYFSDRLGSVTVVVGVSLIIGASAMLFAVVPYAWGAGILFAVIGFCSWSRMPVSESYIISHVSERNRATVLGVYFAGMRALPSVVIPTVGFMIDRMGFLNAFTILGIAIITLTLVCSLFLRGSES